MKKIFRKAIVSVLTLILIGMLLIGCNSNNEKTSESKTQPNKEVTAEEVTKEVTENKNDTSNKDNSNNITELLNETEQNNKELSSIKDPEKLKEKLKDSLGEGEVIKDIIVKDKRITLKIDLGNENNGLPVRDLAETRYAGLAEKLLLNKEWKNITANFIGVGSISMDTKDAVDGQYFKGMDINKAFKN
ncbi:hypothetical protein RBU49_06855 [Clostridium sp. MB40-C1]|uniref:hypothetical protein n=1 Tax=Clostridium sp. MB40-C1 TaxID=3070996 RepID=UPI0027DFCD48|nr:hypothetical protein [Clostridium sp. MB40-C1]WMJ81962.1 hypothetical protein RBU49_06855 [Clostridium sp. MB40-C1]